MMAEYEVIPLLGAFNRLSVAIALEEFENRHGRFPTALVVNHRMVASVEAMLEELGFAIPVQGRGGALLHEVWLQVNDTRKEKSRA